SRYRRMDRTAIETAIQERFASGKPRRPGLLVGTQALEVSLDLDLDACHTSAADLEALVQRFGRVNRLGALDPAPVVVHQPVYDTRRSGGDDLWADGVYEAEPALLGWDILTRHDGQTINEQVITGWLDEIYTSPWGQKWAQRVDEHRSDFEDTFLEFSQPFDDRSELTDAFDEQFEGIEAILAEDHDNYKSALDLANTPSAGRLHADQYLIPLPAWYMGIGTYDKRLKVRVIDAEYDPRLGLRVIRRDAQQKYEPGEIL
ncbi:MAG: CRISPR-associated helicase/endonuclease Cas3, partial [Actinomycetes bacterium]